MSAAKRYLFAASHSAARSFSVASGLTSVWSMIWASWLGSSNTALHLVPVGGHERPGDRTRPSGADHRPVHSGHRQDLQGTVGDEAFVRGLELLRGECGLPRGDALFRGEIQHEAARHAGEDAD